MKNLAQRRPENQPGTRRNVAAPATRSRVFPLAMLVGVGLACALLACDSSRSRSEKTPPPAEDLHPALFKIHGNVRLQDEKSPTGTLVFCAGTSFCAFADADGNYTISAVPAGTYVLFAQREGYESERLDDLILEPSEQPVGADEVFVRSAQLRPIPPPPDDEDRIPAAMAGTGMLSGWVLLADRESPEGVRVELQGAPYSTATNSGGSFSLAGVAPGAYNVLFSRENYNPVSRPVTIEAGRITRLAEPVQLSPTLASDEEGATILGRVLLFTANAQPLESALGVSVRIRETNRVAQTSPDGAFEFTDLEPGTYTLIATMPGFVMNHPVEVAVDDGSEIAVIEMRETGAEEGLKGGLTGVARLGGQQNESPIGTQVALAGTPHSGITDAAGRFSLENIAEGTVTFVCSRRGYKTLEIPSVQILGGAVTDLGVLILEPEAVPPRALSSDPADGTRNVVIRPVVPVRLVFSKRMDLGSLQPAVSVRPPVAFSVRRVGVSENPESPDVVEILLSSELPGPALRFKTRYQITVSQRARDVGGLALEEPFSMIFTTAGLRFISSRPAQNAADGQVLSAIPITISFNGVVKPETLIPRNVTFSPKPAAVGNIWNIRSDPRTGWTILDIPVNLHHNTRYTARLDTAIQALDGTRLDSSGNTLSFRTIPAPVVTPLGR